MQATAMARLIHLAAFSLSRVYMACTNIYASLSTHSLVCRYRTLKLDA